MKITVNNIMLDLHQGARVKDAIMKFYSYQGKRIPKVFPVVNDEYGNKAGPEGALCEGNKLFILNRRRRRASTISFQTLLLITLAFLPACRGSRDAAIIKEQERQAIIFAVNDIHAAIDNFPKLAYIVDSLKSVYPDMLLVSAGDNQTGNPVNDQYPEKGLPVIELMNASGFDLSAVGNHEFDTEQQGFVNLTHKADFSFICANMSVTAPFDLKVEPFKIIRLPNGLKLSFLGLVQLNQYGIPDSHPDKIKGFSFSSPFETARDFLYLKNESDIFIALTHLGFSNDVKLAESMPEGIDLIIGGHSHTRVENEQVHNGILITQAESKLKYGTLIRLSQNHEGVLHKSMELIDIRNYAKEKPSVRAMVDKYNDTPALREVIATATDDFSSHEELGYLMADAQRNFAGADIALVNPGGVRIGNLSRGPITIMDVYQLDPFGNDLIVTKLTGHEIHSLMIAAYPVDGKDLLYPSGLRIQLRSDKDGNPEDFLLMTENDTPLNLENTYTVAMNNYMTSVYKYDHQDPGQSLFITSADATIAWLKKIRNVKSYRGEKRIQIIK
ncbi:MAG TPA: bifunctional UDP-sugar hydrolase/5'-nucleotidase [Bacteroidales bacterium]|nr:bifunctional UDP-sugar hydrolase/5'-nucleotidase [Bacteroidales bacterium]HPF03437.1 bifunctional UDP-sugar hydrolase/5'-nucleotidase [Bacteroidales bacterium]HPJ60103.1 bifunctional UDP-sugar hydrolase/5'-nucleotidase [Bacteroidales bacterium]HRW85340.1 bifunctional UDP-sugar hydrolase/5'-nucleotidase [Bacteroidales bacterium]